MKKETFIVQTYEPTNGHVDPLVPLVVEGGQGLTVTFPEQDNGDQADLYIERKSNGTFSINLSPDGIDIRVSISISDNGQMVVTGVRDGASYELQRQAWR